MTRGRRLAIALGALGALALPLHYPTRLMPPNELSRLYLTQAIVEDRTFSIDGPVARYGQVLDVAASRGRLYSDKAPGLSFLAVPLYGLARAVGLRPELLHAHVRLLTFFLVTLPSLLLLFVAARFSAGKEREREGLVVATAWLVASPALIYASLLFGHQLAALCLLGALDITERAWQGQGERRAAWLAGAGGLAGLGVLVELPVLILSIGVAAYALIRRGLRARDATAFVGALALPLAALGAYNWACFGSAFESSYGHVANVQFAPIHRHGFLGVGWPRPAVIAYWLFGYQRGLLLLAPWFALALLAAATKPGRRAALFGLGFVVYVVVLSGYAKPSGGAAVGPRHMVPALVLLLPLCTLGLGLSLGRTLFFGLACLSSILLWTFHATFPYAIATPMPLAGSFAECNLPGLGSWRVVSALASLSAALASLCLANGRPTRRQLGWGTAAAIALLLAHFLPGSPERPQAVFERRHIEWAIGLKDRP